MSEPIAITVQDVSKRFHLPHEKHSSLKSRLISLVRTNKKGFEIQKALQHIDLEIKQGEFFGIVGRNGSGKSTLLKMLANIYQPTEGKINVQGRLVPFIELGVGFNPELTGRENVYLNGALLGFSEREISAMYDEIVAFAELEKFMDQKLKNYSSGMQVRLAFSMAVRADAEVLLIDEVLAVGDADFQRKCYDYFKQLKKNKKTVVFVSHDMAAVQEFCDRAALIESSHLKLVGKTADIARAYNELFMSDKGSDKQLNKMVSAKRTGNGAVEITNIKLNKSAYMPEDETIELTVTLAARTEHFDLMNGIAVKNAEGQFINGSHTWGEKLKLDDLAVGKTTKVKWQLPNIYEDGLYTIDVHCYGRDHEVYDRIEDAISFRVKRPTRSGCLVNVGVQVTRV